MTVERNESNQPVILTHSAGFDNGPVKGFNLAITGDVSVQGAYGDLVASRIDVAGRGYAGENGPGAGQFYDGTATGAGHGGKDGNGTYASGGSAYDSVRNSRAIRQRRWW